MADEKKVFTIEVYELHRVEYEVEAETLKEAIEKHDDGETDEVLDSGEFLETCLEQGRNGIRSVTIPNGETIWWDQLPEE